MSATPGLGGNFERMTGVTDPYLLTTPHQLSSQAVGRRYFIFPGQSLDETKQATFTNELLQTTAKSVVIVPSKKAAVELGDVVRALGKQVFSIEQLEEDKSSFVASGSACAVLAGRYDGLDFPGNESRLLVIKGLVLSASLQDLFLKTKALGGPMLDDRERTRIVQAVGRCTRSQTDRSAVVIMDDKLVRWFRVKETQSLLPIEMQAEVEFGLAQSSDATLDDMRQRYQDFKTAESDWDDAESESRGARNGKAIGATAGSRELALAAKHEVNFVYALWEGRFNEALQLAKNVIDNLSGDELKGYRGFWELQAAGAAWFATDRKQGEFSDQVRHMVTRASKNLVNVEWLLALASQNKDRADIRSDTYLAVLTERMAAHFEKCGISTNAKFDREVSDIRTAIVKSDSKVFENGLMRLGLLLGYDAGKVEEEGSPDPWWQADESFCFVFEAHSNATAGTIGSNKSRQAAMQERYIREKLCLNKEATVVSVLLSESQPASDASSVYLDGVVLWKLSDFRRWAEQAITAAVDLRNAYSLSNDFHWRLNVAETYRVQGLDPLGLKERLEPRRWKAS